jgi:nicotinamidase/pyrazinamidase
MTKALLIVDMQNDFMPGGPLGVHQADEIVETINALMPCFPLVIATQDWHPKDHVSFADNHPGKKIGDRVVVNGLEQILWKRHCVRNTPGAELVSSLNREPIESIFYKGTDPLIDSYSSFFDNAKQRATGLEEYLKTRGIDEIYIAGVATDYCVLYSARDAVELGFKVFIILDACKGIDLEPGDIDRAIEEMRKKKCTIIFAKDIL